MTRRLEDNMGAEAMRAATGRSHDEWREVLDAAGAATWTHAATARWLVDTHGVSGWWAQGITVDYEQARKGRLPGQQADGTFSTQKARTIGGDRLDALARVTRAVTAVHGEPHGSNLAASMPVVRWRLADGTRLSAAAGRENASGAPITLTWERLPDATRAAAAKHDLAALLEAAQGE